MIEMPEEVEIGQIRKNVIFYMDLAKTEMKNFKDAIEKCNIEEAIPIFSDIHLHLRATSRQANELPKDREWEKITEEIKLLHAESFDSIEDIAKKCEVKSKEPFRYVKEPPKE